MAEVSIKKIQEALNKNDIKSVTRILDDFRIRPYPQTNGSKAAHQLAREMLIDASAARYNQQLKDEMVDLLIVRLAPLANLYGFLNGFLRYCTDHDKPSVAEIPKVILEAIDNNDEELYAEAQDEIYNLTRDKLSTLFDYAVLKDRITRFANRIFIRAAVYSGIIPIYLSLLLFSTTIEEKTMSVEVTAIPFPLGLLGFLQAITGDESDKEDEESDIPTPEENGENNPNVQ